VCTDLGHDPLGIPGEHARLTDVVEAEVQHHHTLQSNAHASVWGYTVLEAIDVRSHRADRNAARIGSLCKGNKGSKGKSAGQVEWPRRRKNHDTRFTTTYLRANPRREYVGRR